MQRLKFTNAMIFQAEDHRSHISIVAMTIPLESRRSKNNHSRLVELFIPLMPKFLELLSTYIYPQRLDIAGANHSSVWKLYDDAPKERVGNRYSGDSSTR